MTNKMKIIIASIAALIVIITTSLILLTGRGIGINSGFKYVYEDNEAIYYFIEDSDLNSIVDTKKLVRFDLETNKFEEIHEDKGLDSSNYDYDSAYNSPLVYSNIYKDFINITTGEVLKTDHMFVCSTDQIKQCIPINEDLVIITYSADNTKVFELFNLSTKEVILDSVKTPYEAEYDDIIVSEFHYFPTDNKFLYKAVEIVYETVTGESGYDHTISNVVSSDFYLADISSGSEEIVTDRMSLGSNYVITNATDDFMYVYDYTTDTVHKYDSSLDKLHSNDFGYIYDINRYVSVARNSATVRNYEAIYRFDDNDDKVKEILKYNGTIKHSSSDDISISKNHVIYKVKTMFLKPDYYVLYDLDTGKELYRNTDFDFLT